MQALLRFIPGVTTMLLYGLFWYAVQRTDGITWGLKIGVSTLISLSIVMLGVYFVTMQNAFKAKFWMNIITPIVLVASTWGTVLFLESNMVRYTVVAVSGVLVWIYLKTIYIYYNQRQKYQAHAIENISSYANVVAMFLFGMTIYNFFLFALFPFWQSLVLGMLVTTLVVLGLTAQMFWVSAITPVQGRLYMGVIVVLMLELLFVTRFLPISIFVATSILSICYYASVGILRNQLLGIIEYSVIRRYTLVSSILLLIILFTAKWQ